MPKEKSPKTKTAYNVSCRGFYSQTPITNYQNNKTNTITMGANREDNQKVTKKSKNKIIMNSVAGCENSQSLNISFKTKHFSFYNHSSKPIQTNTNQQYSSKLNPTQPQNSFTTKIKLFLSTFGVFPNSNTNKRGLGFEPYLNIFQLQYQGSSLFFITLAFYFHGAIHKSPHSKTLSLSLFLKNEKCLNERNVSQSPKYGLYVSYSQGSVWLSHYIPFYLFFQFNTSFHFHFNFISFHLHFCTYTSHLGFLGPHLTFLPNLIGLCKIFRLHIFFVLSI